MVTELNRFEERILETVKWCQERKEAPSRWGMELSKCVREAGLGLPSPELGQVLVSNLCFNFNNPSLWKFIERAITSGLVSSLQVLALLTSRVVPNRRTQPEAYRLYLELLSQYSFSPSSTGTDACRIKIIKCVDDALQLSQNYGVPIVEFGHALVLFLFSVIVGLIDSTLEDWGLQLTSLDKLSGIFGGGGPQDMDVDYKGNHNDKRNEFREQLCRKNAFTAMEILGKLTENRKTMQSHEPVTGSTCGNPCHPLKDKNADLVIFFMWLPIVLLLFHIQVWHLRESVNRSTFQQQETCAACWALLLELFFRQIYGPSIIDGGIHWLMDPMTFHVPFIPDILFTQLLPTIIQRLQFLEANKLVSSNSKSASQFLTRLSANIQKALGLENQLNKRRLIGSLIDIGSHSMASCCNFGTGRAACWVPFDIYMEATMDGKQLLPTSATDVLTELIEALQVINRSSWQQTFQALWISALRLVQRERDPVEGPIPHLDARLSILLSITPLAIVRVLDDEVGLPLSSRLEGSGSGNTGTRSVNGRGHASKKQGLVSSLQSLGQFSGLLSPPTSVVIAANSAAAKAVNFISNFKNGSNSFNGSNRSDTYVKAGDFASRGNMLHLIVEACIARKLIDTLAYSWPGYVSTSVTSLSDSSLGHGSPWSTFMEGAQLAGPLKDALIATPASSLVEIEKLYHIALNGSEEERVAAAKILCGASLSRGWNIQEHVVHFVIKLLAPPAPPNFTGLGSHLIGYTSMLNTILFGLSSADMVHVLSLHGMLPEVAASLMPLCETFGSLVPTSGHKPSAGDESSAYLVFSCAFLFLLRLWKFYRPPHEHITEGGGYTGYELTLEYLLILHNSRNALHNSTATDKTNKVDNPLETSSIRPVYIESFPKLRAWYCQNKACIASTLSSLSSGNPVQQVANKILNMIYWKMTKGGVVSTNLSTHSSSSISGSPITAGEDAYERPMLPAWEVLEAIPFVLEAVLSACAHGRLSSRDLTTGLRDLVDFLPASLATIISYFSAEITRGIWKPVSMNGTDWPSPAVNLLSIESEVKEILAPLGVTIPSCSTGIAPVMLPLPVAALVSLTITFKLDKGFEYIHVVAGHALENCASSCPWPSMPIIGALWAQKVRRLYDFIVVTCSRSVFKQDKEAVAQLLRSCFASFLGSPHVISPATAQMGVNGLLGSTISARGLRPSIAPGFLYLRSCRTMQNILFVNNVIVGLVVESARESAAGLAHANSARLKSSQSSLASATARAKEVAMLGASLLCVPGGVQLVQVLYRETIPMWLLSAREGKLADAGPMSCILEGYTMAYLMILSGSFVWGVRETSSTRSISRRARILRVHTDFMVGALEGYISLACDPATWKAYVSCFVGLLVSFVPSWIREIKQETLKKLADGLRGWHECELALSLLERGGTETMGYVAELVTVD